MMEADLSSLLDDALADFEKPFSAKKEDETSAPREVCSKVASTSDPLSSQPSTDQSSFSSMAPPTDVFKEFFDDDVTEKLQSEWVLAMKELSDENPQLAKQIHMMSKAAESLGDVKDDSGKGDATGSFDEKMKATLESMSKGLDEDDISEEEMMNKFMNFGMNESTASEEMNGLGMMEGLMQSMLSKDMLYPPMKELSINYPQWLESNKDSISKNQKEKYEGQLACLKRICAAFESESETDSEDKKKKRFVHIMDTINEMQQYGQPPEELAPSGNSTTAESCTIS